MCIFTVYCSLYLVCCCWLLQDCIPGHRRPAHYRNHPPDPPGHHPRPTDPLVGPSPAPSRFGTPAGLPGVANPLAGPMGGTPGGPPGVPNPLAGPPGEDPVRFEPPGPPVPPGPHRY